MLSFGSISTGTEKPSPVRNVNKFFLITLFYYILALFEIGKPRRQLEGIRSISKQSEIFLLISLLLSKLGVEDFPSSIELSNEQLGSITLKFNLYSHGCFSASQLVNLYAGSGQSNRLIKSLTLEET